MKRKINKKHHRKNQVKIQFTGKPVTAWGGIASLMARYLTGIHFREWVECNVPVVETSNNGKGIFEKVLGQFITVSSGGSRFSHVSWWGHGVEVIQKAFGVKWLPKAGSTLTRFWSKFDIQSKNEIWGERCRHLVRDIIGWEGIVEDNLNLDSTIMTRYGEQEGAEVGYNPKKKGRPSHHPLIGFLSSGYIVNLWNRPGNTSAGQGAVDFFRQTVESMKGVVRIKRVLCDAGFYDIKFIKYLEKHEFVYIIAAPVIRILQREISGVKEWARIARGIDVGEFYFEHLDEKWEKPRRYVVIRQEIRQRRKAAGKQLSLFKEDNRWCAYRFSLMITGDEKLSPEEVWREYRPRACDENVIKDLKEGYRVAAFNMNGFWATEAVMVMNALVFYNLIHYFNVHILNVNRAKEHLKTIRAKYFILPGILGSGGGYSILRLGVKDKSFRSRLRYVLNKIEQIGIGLNGNAVET